MEDMIVIKNDPVEFKNRELNNATQKIFKIGERMQKNLYEVANVLAKVDTNKAYKEDGFKSAADYAMKTFGFKKTQAYTLLKVGKEWTSPKLESTLPHEEGKDFTVTQIEKLAYLGSKEEVIKAVENGDVTPEMTVAEIREYVKTKKGMTKEEHESWHKKEIAEWTASRDTAKAICNEIENIYDGLKQLEFLLGTSKDAKKVTKFVEHVNDMDYRYKEILEENVFEKEESEELTND